MVENILLCSDGSEYADTAADYALLLARGLRARIAALHVIDTRLLQGPYLADLGGSIGAQPYEAFLPAMQAIQQEKADLILGALDRKLSPRGVPYSMTIRTGTLVGTILAEESGRDLVVLGKRGEHARYETNMIGSSVEWIVRRSVKPCLVTPFAFRPIRRVVAACDGSSHAEKALGLALEIVLGLRLELSLVTVAASSDRLELGRSILEEGAVLASSKGVKAHTALLTGHPDEKIVEHCHREEADLLVIGAYGHSRIREFLLGSTTFQILLKSEIPVFLMR